MIIEYHCNYANVSVEMLLFHTTDRRVSDELPVEAQADRWDGMYVYCCHQVRGVCIAIFGGYRHDHDAA
jgi:hypothetical protein